MNADEKIRSAQERSIRGLSKRPELGMYTSTVTARVTDGLTCVVDMDGRALVTDVPEIAGGNNQGATPTHVFQASLASCLAIGYRAHFVALGVPVNGIEVEVTGDEDARANYGLDGIPAGFLGPLRYRVRIDSPADAATVQQVLDGAEARSPVLGTLTNPVTLERRIELQHKA